MRYLAIGDPAIVVRDILSASDVGAIREASGVLATSEGVSSHFALLASSLGKPCLVDVKDARLVGDSIVAETDGHHVFREGDWITLDEFSSTLLPSRAEQVGGRDEVPEDVLDWAVAMLDRDLLVNGERKEEVLLAEAMGAQGVGLCRSERHLILSAQGLQAFRAVAEPRDQDARRAAVEEVCRVLGSALEELLRESNTKRVSYRLLDPDPNDFGLDDGKRGALASRSAATTQVSLDQPIGRGAAFRRSFEDLYERQIATAIAVAESVALSSRCPINLSLVVPMVSDAEEYRRWVQCIRHTSVKAEARSGNLLAVKVGAMIETPRGALIAGHLAKMSDVLLIGTNDLTAAVWGIDRFARNSADGLAFNPLQEFDGPVVGNLIASAVAAARASNAGVKITICGAHAGNAKDSGALLRTGVDGLSCSLSRLPRVALEMARLAGSGWTRPTQPPVSTAARLFRDLMNDVLSRNEDRSDPTHSSELFEWAADICADLGVPPTGVWKFFKRDLVACWFGEREARRFMPPWQLDDVLGYALSIQAGAGARIRVSVFPPGIAFRARSELLADPVDPSSWRRQLSQLNHDLPIEIFPQQPKARTAFRAVLREQTLMVEGALGQAIDVFWKSPADLLSLQYNGATGEIRADDRVHGFVNLMERHISDLFARAASLRDFLGMDWISVEGYAGPQPEASLFVADVDLPLDALLIDAEGGVDNSAHHVSRP